MILKAIGTGKVFGNIHEVLYAHEMGHIDLQAAIKARINGKVQETSVGRAILSDIVPKGVPFETVNRVMNKKALADLIDKSFRLAGGKATVILADKLMELGFKYSTRAGISICVDDMLIPAAKEDLLREAEGVPQVQRQRVRLVALPPLLVAQAQH